MSRRTIGVIGVGQMGLPIARHLCKAFGTVRVFDVSSEQLERARQFGAVPCGSLSELAGACQSVFVSLPNFDTVSEVLGGEDGVLSLLSPGDVVIDMSTITPMLCRNLASQAAERSVTYFDAPLSGGVSGAEAGTLAAMVGGDPVEFARVKPLLECFTRVVTYLGPSGSGQATKLTHQLVFLASVAAFCEGAVMAERWGVDPLAVLNAMQHNIVPLRLLDVIEPRLRSLKQQEPNGPLAVPYVDFPELLAFAEDTAVEPLVTRPLYDLYKQAIENGCTGRNDLFALGRAFLGDGKC